MTGSKPIELLQFLPVLHIGGTERHVVSLTTGIDRARFSLHVGCMKREGELLADIEDHRIPVTEYPIQSLYGLHTVRQQLRLAAYLRRKRIDIVHTYNFYANCFAVPAARLAGTRLVVASIRDTGAFLTPHQRRAQRIACRLAHVLLVNADAVRQWLIGQGYDARKITVIRNGIDLGKFRTQHTAPGVRQELGIPADAPVVAMFARVNRLKGVEYFLEAAASIASRFPSSRFLLVGDATIVRDGACVPNSEYRSELDREIGRLGLAGRVIFTGFRHDIPEILSQVTVSVLPSLSEGFPNAVLEAMAAGVPVVASRVGGIPEAVKDGVTGLLVPSQDSAALAEAVGRLLGDADLAKRLGQAAHEHIVASFSLERMVRQTEDFYVARLRGARGGASGAPEST